MDAEGVINLITPSDTCTVNLMERGVRHQFDDELGRGSPLKVINHNGQLWLTAEEVGLCLGYGEANANIGVNNLYNP